MKYQYGILLTDVSPEADLHNNTLLGECTLGIEVTSPTLAARCGLGNIDPQHYSGGSSSAIEEALMYPLPPGGACLVTIRQDKDSLGAMAVLMLRAQGREDFIDKYLVSWIGALDRMGFHNACVAHPHLASANMGDTTDAIQVIINSSDSRWPTIEAKVLEIGRILINGMPSREISSVAALKKRNFKNFDVEMLGAVAFITVPGEYGSARDWGGRRYPVVVVFDSAYVLPAGGTQQRWSVLRQPNVFDRRGFEEKINAAEAEARGLSVAELENKGYAWGGPRSIVSSPMGKGRDSALSKETILKIAQECAQSGRVS